MLYSHLLQYLGNSRRCPLILFLLLERFPWGQQRCPKMRFRLSIAHFLGSTFFSFKYCSPFYLRIVRTYFYSSIAHLERFVQDGEFSWTVNSSGHFLMAPMQWCQCRGCGGEAPARFSEHCTVSGQGVQGQSPC